MDILASLGRLLFFIQGSLGILISLALIGFGIYFIIYPSKTDNEKDYTGITMASAGTIMLVIFLSVGKKISKSNSLAEGYLDIQIFKYIFKALGI
jgi:threonine/homoserine efflux transporter RhtA